MPTKAEDRLEKAIDELIEACMELVREQRSVRIGQATKEELREWLPRTAQHNAAAKAIALKLASRDLMQRAVMFENKPAQLQRLKNSE